MGGTDERLRRMADTHLGSHRDADLGRVSARALGKARLEAFYLALTPDSSVYDAYNHLTLVSQQRKMGPRRELEVIAEDLLSATMV